MNQESSRRPLKVRDAKWSQQFAAYLSKKDITPNAISVGSVLFAVLAAYFIWDIENFVLLYSVLAALFIQMRLLCNLFDGMVALEGGKTTKSGELYNDIPDRISDSILFIALGYALDLSTLGYLAALFAMMTAYVRVLGASMGAGSSFAGPMAKQHRMAVLTTTLLLTPVEYHFIDHNFYLLQGALWMTCIGSVLTVLNRTRIIYNTMERS